MKQAHRWWFVLVGIAFLGYGCGDRSPSSMAEAEPTAPEATPEAVVKVAKTEDAVKPLPTEGKLPDELAASEDVLQRLPQVSAGRANPFATILSGPVQVRPRTPSSEATASASVPAPPTILPPAGPGVSAPSQGNPPAAAPTAPAAAPSATVPTQAAPAPPSATPPSLASQIRISGIVQIGNQLSVLVEVPNGGGSRPVRVGEEIISGRVRLARVDVAANREPQIVLEEAGVETIKTVDSGV